MQIQNGLPPASPVRLMFVVSCLALLAGCGGGGSGSSLSSTHNVPPPSPTTTLQAETANNTSASGSFSAQLNGLPAPANVSKVDTHSLLYSGSTTQIFAGLQGWFGESGHMNVGYNSNDPQQVQSQVADMQSRGIQGAILDWYGQNGDPVVNSTAQALRAAAEARTGFQFAIMEDAGALSPAAFPNGCDLTAQLLTDLNYINTEFVPSSAYMRINGRPVILFFGVDAFYIDWTQIQAQVANNPLLLFRGTDGLTRTISNGGFQWEDIGASAFLPASPNPFDPGLAAQDAFYQTNPAGRLAFGSVYRGFNDSLAPWGIDRFVHPNCGQTWLATFNEISKFYSSSNQLSALQIVTWNDYDEGSAMEMGIDNCVYLQPGISGSTVNWAIGGGSENTIDHYTVFSTTDGQNLAKLADVPVGTHSLELSQFHLPSGLLTLYVKATGRPSIQNKMSPPIVFLSGHQSPAVSLAVSQTGALTFSVTASASAGSFASTTLDFGDGTVVAGPSASHTYASVGVYNITATALDNAGASAVAIQPVSAKAVTPGVTIFSPLPSGVVNWPSPTFVASASSANPITQMNVLVDGTQIYAINQDILNTPLKVYTGSHNVEVQAIDSTGAISSATVAITAEPGDPAPVPLIQMTPLPQANTVLFCGSGWQDPNRFVNAFEWTFSDGSTMEFTPGVAHTFPSAGTFTVTQSVVNEFGSPASITQSVTTTGTTGSTTPATTIQRQDEQTQKQNLPIRLPQLEKEQH